MNKRVYVTLILKRVKYKINDDATIYFIRWSIEIELFDDEKQNPVLQQKKS